MPPSQCRGRGDNPESARRRAPRALEGSKRPPDPRTAQTARGSSVKPWSSWLLTSKRKAPSSPGSYVCGTNT